MIFKYSRKNNINIKDKENNKNIYDEENITHTNSFNNFARILVTSIMTVQTIVKIILAIKVARLTAEVQSTSNNKELVLHDKRDWLEENFTSLITPTRQTKELSNLISLEKRNKWLWASLAIGGAVISLAAGLAPLWAPAWVGGLFGKVIVSLLASAGTAAGVVGTVGAVKWDKRDGHRVLIHGEHFATDKAGVKMFYYDVAAKMGEATHHSLTNYNNFNYTAFTVHNSSANAAGGLMAKSDIGNHLIKSNNDTQLTDVISAIAYQHETNCIGECALRAMYGSGNNTLSKRTNYYMVNWASYNFDVWSASIAEEELENPDVNYAGVEDSFNAQYQEQGYPDTWKYCMCVDGSYSGAYDTLGNSVGLAGELYTNTYGGVDGFCDTSTCGAQCSDDGC